MQVCIQAKSAHLTPTSARRSTTSLLRSSLTKQHTAACPAAKSAVFASNCACEVSKAQHAPAAQVHLGVNTAFGLSAWLCTIRGATGLP